jgi:hypothetical protein
MLYELNNQIYIKQGDKYFLADITKKRNTIVINPSSEYVDVLEDAKEVSFYEVKKKVLKWIK